MFNDMLVDENLYYVGGYVRDQLLGLKSFDIDYCYEGDAIKFAKSLGLNIIQENPNFGTVRVLYNNREIDIASTRLEVYPKNGHLPQIVKIGCSLQEDLKRRDFTVNTLLMRTTNNQIIDYYNGISDIKNKTLRVLHSDSFIEDPTRMIRALKFSVRFNFKLDDYTKLLQNEYLKNINFDISYHRLKKELVETFNLNKRIALEIFIESGLYKLLGKNQKIPRLNCDIENELKCFETEYIWLMYLGLFDLSNFELSRKEKRILEWCDRLRREGISNNTPKESVMLYKLYSDCSF